MCESGEQNMEPQEAWDKALRELDAVSTVLFVGVCLFPFSPKQVARLIRGLAADVSSLNGCRMEAFDERKDELEKAEVESRRVKELLRDATKAFKAKGLTAPGKEDRGVVEKKYLQIKVWRVVVALLSDSGLFFCGQEDLANARNDWREALARAQYHEATKALQSARTRLLEHVATMKDAEARGGLDELGEREKSALAKFDTLAETALSVVRGAEALHLEKKKGEVEAEVAEKRAELCEHFAKRREKLKAGDNEARKLADLLSEYAQWHKKKLEVLAVRKFSPDETLADADRKCEQILAESDAKRAAITRLKIKAPSLDSVHQELVASCDAYKQACAVQKRMLKQRGSSLASVAESFVQEPVFVQEADFNPYRERIAKALPVWTEEELAKLLQGDCKPNVKGLSVSECETLVRDLAVAVVQNHQRREPEDNDRLLQCATELFEKAIAASPKNVDLKMDAASNVINWISLRCKMDHIVFKGPALFPLLDRALLWLQQAHEAPRADRQKVQERVKVIEGLRKRAKTLDDCTSSRMLRVLEQQKAELTELEQLSTKLLMM